jgi:hypothetical protein
MAGWREEREKRENGVRTDTDPPFPLCTPGHISPKRRIGLSLGYQC